MTYHHGDARAALLRAAFDLARAGGPATVTLRAAAREVGITATAVYRHFTTVEELLAAVKGRSLRVLGERMDKAVSAIGGDCAADSGSASGSDSGARRDSDRGQVVGSARIRAVAEAYVSFAREHAGLFAMACHGGVDDAVALVAERVAGLPYPERLAVWSAAHGAAALTVSEAEQQRVLHLVLAGIVR